MELTMESGAVDETRTRKNILLGRQTLYQLNYYRIWAVVFIEVIAVSILFLLQDSDFNKPAN